MKVGPGNVLALCRLCCCGPKTEAEAEPVMMQTEPEGVRKKLSHRMSSKLAVMMSNTVSSKTLSSVVANENRPVDAISFLGNERWIIDDVTEVQPLPQIATKSAAQMDEDIDIVMNDVNAH